MPASAEAMARIASTIFIAGPASAINSESKTAIAEVGGINRAKLAEPLF